MGYALMFSACCSCGRVVGYNPMRVPSVRIDGVRQPLCRDCVDRANNLRIAQQTDPIVVLPGAYDPVDESEMP